MDLLLEIMASCRHVYYYCTYGLTAQETGTSSDTNTYIKYWTKVLDFIVSCYLSMAYSVCAFLNSYPKLWPLML